MERVVNMNDKHKPTSLVREMTDQEIELLFASYEKCDSNSEEEEIVETDESGWSIVRHKGTLYFKKTMVHGNVTSNVYRPILKSQERAKREKQIMSNVARILSKYDNL